MTIFFAVLVWLFLAIAVAGVAEQKGLDRVEYFLYGLILSPLIGFLLVAVAKPDEAGLVRSGAARKCPHCAEIVKNEAKVCRFCGREIEVVSPALKKYRAQRAGGKPPQPGR